MYNIITFWAVTPCEPTSAETTVYRPAVGDTYIADSIMFSTVTMLVVPVVPNVRVLQRVT